MTVLHTGRSCEQVCQLMVCLFLCLACTGCNVGRALVGQEGADTSSIRLEASRMEVETALGPPVLVRHVRDRELFVYEYDPGFVGGPEKALATAYGDLVTLGLGELIRIRSPQRVQIEYDDANRVIDIYHFNPPPSVTGHTSSSADGTGDMQEEWAGTREAQACFGGQQDTNDHRPIPEKIGAGEVMDQMD